MPIDQGYPVAGNSGLNSGTAGVGNVPVAGYNRLDQTVPPQNQSPVSGGGLVSTTSYASAAALETAFPAASNSGKLGLVGGVLYVSNGTAWAATGSSTSRVTPEITLFTVPLRADTSQLANGNALATVAFSRNFQLATLQSNGLFAEAAHNTAAFAWVPGANRHMLAGSGPCSGVVSVQRDFTNAAWVKTNITAAKDATGIDGTANAASSATATAALGTVLFPATATANTRVFQAHVKRKAGYGRVWMTGDGGTSWTDVTAQIGPNYARVWIPVLGTNPSCGFMLENSADAIICDSMACIQSAYPVPTAFLSRQDMQTQSLSYTGARKASNNAAFVVKFNWYFDNTSSGTVSINKAGGYPTLIISASQNSNPLPQAQLLTSSGTVYGGIPTLFRNARAVQPGVIHEYKVVCSGPTIYTYLDGQPVSIYDAPLYLSALTPQDFNDLYIDAKQGNYVSDVEVRDWLGNVVVGIGDSMTAIECYRQGWLAALPKDSIFVQRGVGGDTVAMVRDRIATGLMRDFPAKNPCYCILWCGTNSLAMGNTSMNTLAELQTAINNILAINANVRIVLPTTLTYRAGGLTGITQAQFAINAAAYNAGLSSLTGVYRVVEINDATLTNPASFEASGIHLLAEAYSLVIQKLAPVIAL
jgi:hypothetical protein